MKILRMFFIASLFSVSILSSCTQDEDPVPAGAITANAGPDKQIQSGSTVTLDGSASKDSKGTPLTYSWAVVQKPANSNPVLTTPTIVNPVFAPDLEGVYELELTVTNEHGIHKDKVVVTVAFIPVILSHITTRTVLEDLTANPDLADYWVNDDLGVDAELIVKPGVVIAFAEDAAMSINDDGSLSAKGEPNRKITFTGKMNQQGYWKGILVFSNSSDNELLNAEVLNAGSTIMVSEIRANITVWEGGRLSMKNTKVAGSKGYGIYYAEESIITGFASNTISNNNVAPVLLSADHVSKLDAASSFSVGNGRNVIQIVPSFLTGSTEVVWPAFADNTPYRLLGLVVVQTGLKLSPGITMEFAEDNYFEIGDGYLNAIGTADKKIVFTGVDKTASSWMGIIIYSGSNLNVLQHVEVNYAGNSNIISGVPAGIVLTSAANLTVKNSSISHSGGYGIFVNGTEATLNSDAGTVNSFVSNADDAIFYKD